MPGDLDGRGAARDIRCPTRGAGRTPTTTPHIRTPGKSAKTTRCPAIWIGVSGPRHRCPTRGAGRTPTMFHNTLVVGSSPTSSTTQSRATREFLPRAFGTFGKGLARTQSLQSYQHLLKSVVAAPIGRPAGHGVPGIVPAISARRSARPSAQRDSIATVRPSIQPSLRSRSTRTAAFWRTTRPSYVAALRKCLLFDKARLRGELVGLFRARITDTFQPPT